MNNTTGKEDIEKLQRTAILNTAHVLRKVGHANVHHHHQHNHVHEGLSVFPVP
jgi:hypothetical protein